MPFKKARQFTLLFSVLFSVQCIGSKHPGRLLTREGRTAGLLQTDSIPAFADSTHTDAFLEELLKQHPHYFGSILNKLQAHNLQVIYTRVDRGANGIAALKNFYFNVNPGRYFYPAATVELPISMLTMQRLNELKTYGIDKNTTMLSEAAFSKQTAAYNDPMAPGGKPSVAGYLKRMLITGDGRAADRLYEFLGQQYINNQLAQKGYPSAQVCERQEAGLTEEEHRHTNPVQFLGPGNRTLYRQPLQYNTKPYLPGDDSSGRAFYHSDMIAGSPVTLTGRNKITIEDLHTLLTSLVFPNKVTSSRRFNITDDDRQYILKYMSQLPTETIYPPYSDDTVNYYPAYNKYLLYGTERGVMPSNIRIFNTGGEAFGQLVDIAYIVDFDKKIEFFLSAVIYCNTDGEQDDNKYDYEKIGLPFMKHLGRVIYDYETGREKKILPGLEELRFEYDGR